MDRQMFKTLAHGKFIETHRGESLDQKCLNEFVEGALYAFDMLMKPKTSDEKKVVQPPKMEASN